MTTKIWTKRPPASSPRGQVAWDLLGEMHAEWRIAELWFAPEMDDGAWCARFDNGEYDDVDVLVTTHRADQLRMLRMYFKAGRLAARTGTVAEVQQAWTLPTTTTQHWEEFERGIRAATKP